MPSGPPVPVVIAKPWYASKTIWVAVIQAIISLLVVFATQYPEVGMLLVGKSIADIVLRFVTNTIVT